MLRRPIVLREFVIPVLMLLFGIGMFFSPYTQGGGYFGAVMLVLGGVLWLFLKLRSLVR